MDGRQGCRSDEFLNEAMLNFECTNTMIAHFIHDPPVGISRNGPAARCGLIVESHGGFETIREPAIFLLHYLGVVEPRSSLATDGAALTAAYFSCRARSLLNPNMR